MLCMQPKAMLRDLNGEATGDGFNGVRMGSRAAGAVRLVCKEQRREVPL
jgi:hypothetical protein